MPDTPLEEALSALLWYAQEDSCPFCTHTWSGGPWHSETCGLRVKATTLIAAAKAEAVEPFRQLLYDIEAVKHDTTVLHERLLQHTGRLIAEARTGKGSE